MCVLVLTKFMTEEFMLVPCLSVSLAAVHSKELRVVGHLAVRGRAALLRVLSQKLKQLQGCNKDLRRGLCLYSMQQKTQGSNCNTV